MNPNILEIILAATGATHATPGAVIQSLWSGYGEVVRIRLEGASVSSVVLKHIKFPTTQHHPRGWNTGLSHQRKVKSYQVEMAWYQYWGKHCHSKCRIPHCYTTVSLGDAHILLLEDLDLSGFSLRHTQLDKRQAKLGLTWLAHFHANFLGKSPEQYSKHPLWQEGTYWHLATRPDELHAMQQGPLKDHAQAIDGQLRSATYQTLVHGDAKLANFCFADDGTTLAAVDFQYIGGGCGMKDVAYFLGSCLHDKQLYQWQDDLLNTYFSTLASAVDTKHPHINSHALEQEWRRLYPVAWADFYRFLVGWMPTHAKINDYGQQLTAQVLKRL